MPKIIQPKSKDKSSNESNGTKLSDRVREAQEGSRSLSDNERRVKILWRSECGLYAILRITEDSISSEYLMQWVSSPAVFSLECLEPGKRTTYTVILNGKDHTYCGCSEFMESKDCSHLRAMEALGRAGKLK